MYMPFNKSSTDWRLTAYEIKHVGETSYAPTDAFWSNYTRSSTSPSNLQEEEEESSVVSNSILN